MSDGGAKRKAAKQFTYPSPLVTGAFRVIGLTVSKIFWSIRYHSKEHIPKTGGFVIVSNHSTYPDPVWISIPTHKDMRFMAWEQAFEWPVVGRLIRYLGAFPVKHRSTTSKSVVVESLRTLRSSGTLMIFPEGEREFADGKMLEFKSGAVHLALNSGVPVLPVSIRGGNKIWPQGQKYPRLFKRVEVTFHPPLELPAKKADEDLDTYLENLNSELEKIIALAM